MINTELFTDNYTLSVSFWKILDRDFIIHLDSFVFLRCFQEILNATPAIAQACISRRHDLFFKKNGVIMNAKKPDPLKGFVILIFRTATLMI